MKYCIAKALPGTALAAPGTCTLGGFPALSGGPPLPETDPGKCSYASTPDGGPPEHPPLGGSRPSRRGLHSPRRSRENIFTHPPLTFFGPPPASLRAAPRLDSPWATANKKSFSGGGPSGPPEPPPSAGSRPSQEGLRSVRRSRENTLTHPSETEAP